MVVIDTDVFICDLALLRTDRERAAKSTEFLRQVADPWTTVFKLRPIKGHRASTRRRFSERAVH